MWFSAYHSGGGARWTASRRIFCGLTRVQFRDYFNRQPGKPTSPTGYGQLRWRGQVSVVTGSAAGRAPGPWNRNRWCGSESEIVAQIDLAHALVFEDGRRVAFGNDFAVVDDVRAVTDSQGFANVMVGD